MHHTHVLVATLGGQPQIVTFTLDLLLQKGFPISEVIVLHPRAATRRLQRALQRLQGEFAGDYYATGERTIHFRSQVLELDDEPIDDIVDDMYADGTLNTIHRLIGDLKREGQHIHLSLSGGRRLMSLLAISVATLNFDRHDHVWHLYTPEAVKEQADEGKIMHVPADTGVRLIQGPFVFLGAYIYDPARPFRAVQQEQRNQVEARERKQCTEVVEKATPAQLKVLQAFAKGLKPQQVAAELYLSLATIHTHKTVLLQLCHNAWGIDPDEYLDYHFLQSKFVNYFSENG